MKLLPLPPPSYLSFAAGPATVTFVCTAAGGDGGMLSLAALVPKVCWEWAAFGDFVLFRYKEKAELFAIASYLYVV